MGYIWRACEVKRLAAALLCCSLIFPVAAATDVSPKNELSELRDRIMSLQKEAESAEGAKADASDALKHSEQAISAANRKLYELAQQQQEVKGEVSHLQQDSAKTKSRIDEQRAQLGQLLTRLYLHGQHDYLEIILNQQDPNRLVRHLRYYADISRARATLIQNLRGNLKQLRGLTEAGQKKAEELERIKSEQDAQKKQLEKEQIARKALLIKLNKKIAAQRHEIGKLQNDEKRLTRLIEKLSKMAAKPTRSKKAQAPEVSRSAERESQSPESNTVVPTPEDSGSPFQQLKGKLHLPIKGALAGRFGSPREDSGATWKGLFIRSPAGQPVKAVAGGQVVFSDWLRGFGNIIIIDHGGNFMSLYGNNETLYKQAGENVKMGDTVASVGNSGGIPDSGLYFELRYQSKPLDPMAWVALK
ncbi:MAG: peptidoglycan DD-metalloendopeptidase family protein [Sulfuricellaceae bacterium]